MEAQSERTEGVLIFAVSGRLDTYGARQLGEMVQKALQDDDRYLVIDLTASPYLSSGGIRTLGLLRREMQRRNGRFALTGVGEYPRKVLVLAGFDTIFEIFATSQDAVHDMQKGPARSEGGTRTTIRGDGVTLTVEPDWTPAAPVLRVVGSLDRLLHARLTQADIRTKGFQEINYSLGLGALGASLADALPFLGEMITLHGSMVWLPTDGHSTPDFLTPHSTGDVPVYLGYDVTLEGPFNEYLILETDDPQGVTLSGIYQAIMTGAKQRVENCHGVVAVAIWGIIAGFASSGLKKSPIATYAPPDGASILDPAYVQDWLASDVGTSYNGDTLVSFGIGVDLEADLSYFDPDTLSALHYSNPLNREAARGLYLHNHGVVFRNVPYDPSLDLNTEVRKCVTEGEFLDMRHLLDSTRVRKAKIGVAYVQNILRES